MGKVKERMMAEAQEAQNQPVPEVGPEELSEAIKFHRKKTRLSQIELSRLAGVGKTAVFDLEKGKQTVQLDTLLKVLQVLNISMLFQSPMMETFLRNTK